MKPLYLLLALSLLGNAGLLYSALRVTSAPAAEKRSLPAPSATAAAAATTSARDPGAPVGAAARPLWSRVNCDDIEQLAARLKEAGFTAREIAVIVSPRIAEKFDFFWQLRNGAPRPYWQPDRPDWSDPKMQEAMRRNMQEAQRLYEKLWNSPEQFAADPDAQEHARRRFGNLPLEKLQRLQQLESDYQQLSLKTSLERNVRPGETIGTDRMAAHRLIEQEKQAEIAKLLTPEEFAEYEIRGSQLAQSLKYRLRTFQPTEDEYLALFAIQKSYQTQLNDPAKTPGQQNGVMSDIRKDVAKILGPERAEDYAAAYENAHDETANLVLRLGLPARVAPQVRTLQKDFTAQAATIRANAQLSAADRATQLAALAQQARAAITAKLGAQGFEAYDDRKGEWIRAIENPAPGKP